MLCFVMLILFSVCIGFSIKHEKTRERLKWLKIECGFLTDEEEEQKEEATVRVWSWLGAAFVFELIFISLLFKSI